jgi:hypothetical protein
VFVRRLDHAQLSIGFPPVADLLSKMHREHVQEWAYVMPNGAQVRVRSDLRRVANQR